MQVNAMIGVELAANRPCLTLALPGGTFRLPLDDPGDCLSQAQYIAKSVCRTCRSGLEEIEEQLP